MNIIAIIVFIRFTAGDGFDSVEVLQSCTLAKRSSGKKKFFYIRFVLLVLALYSDDGLQSEVTVSGLSRILKRVFASLGALVIVILIIPIFLSSRFSMSRSIQIDAPVGVVFAKLTDLNEYMKWNPFPEGDPTNQAEVSGSGVGSSLSWRGEKTGEGKMTISKIKPETQIDIKMDFYKPMSGEGMVYWVTSSKSDAATEMTWKFEQELSYFNRYFGLMMNSMMGPHFEKGLINFKAMVEASK